MIASTGLETSSNTAEHLRRLRSRWPDELPPFCIVDGNDPSHSDESLDRTKLVLAILPSEIEQSIAFIRRTRAATPSKIAAVGTARDPKSILCIIRAGADDYLDCDSDLAGELNALVTRTTQTVSAPIAPARVFSVVSPSGGSGCTTTAVNLAAALLKSNHQTLLCDLDLFGGDVGAMLNCYPRHSISDLCRNLHKLDQSMFDQSLVNHSCGISVLAAPQTCEEVEHVSWDAIRKVIDLARRKFDLIVIDGENPFRHPRALIPQISDVIFIVFRLDFTSLKNTALALRYLKKLGVDDQRVRLVVNRYGQPKELPRRKVQEALKRKVDVFLPDDAKTINGSINVGAPAVLESPVAKISKAFEELVALTEKELAL